MFDGEPSQKHIALLQGLDTERMDLEDSNLDLVTEQPPETVYRHSDYL